MPSAKTLKAIVTVVVAVVAIVLGLVLSSRDSDSSASSNATAASQGTGTSKTAVTSSAKPKPGAGPTTTAKQTTAKASSSDAPARVLATLVEIDAGRWPDSANSVGTKGGITFRNSEGRLPAVGAGGGRVVYQEWDVNPKKNGQGRDAERIVTGNDGSAWYTLDHYDNFTRIR
ncbi:ribonuclease N [Rhodococcus sp. SRB_17]|uniref:ribonuclease domain-containing protein n=1 Tax=Rhodococcus sp. OK302 TaxID=1882769 RepID=UPI000B93EA5D|nr:ribonuclease domain-containing protein [Rhodococcus sp. OK302]NMM91885.1 ribonuclease N [Rhodococcus sp. SRB_17]OYD69084.1 guanyl-specific ribonuclease Sa [Rhodococcus sp. OK302]